MPGKRDRLIEIEDLGRVQFSVGDVCLALNEEISGLLRDIKTPEGQAYKRGQLEAEAKVRKSILLSALDGSNQAQKQYLSIVQDRPDHPNDSPGQAHQDRLMPAKACMAVLGKSYSASRRWLKKGCPHKRQGRRILMSPHQVSVWLADNGYTGRVGPRSMVDRASSPGSMKDQLVQAELDKRLALIKKYSLEHEIRQGEFLHRDQVMADRIKRIHAIKTVMLSMPGRLSGELAPISDEKDVYEILETWVNDTLKGFAGG